MQPAMHGGASLDSLEKSICYTFRNKNLPIEAFTHSSAAKHCGLPDYQRLEFLGDAVLSICVSKYLFDAFPNASEGEMTRRRIELVSGTSLMRVSRKLNLPKYLGAARVELTSPSFQNSKVLADIYESLIAAIYVDGGMEAAEKFIKKTLISCCDECCCENHRGTLQEKLQSIGKTPPVYEIMERTGQAHCPTFHVRVLVEGSPLGEGIAGSKKEACQIAAKNALDALAATVCVCAKAKDDTETT